MEAPLPALNTVRGFHGTPMTSGDEDSDHGNGKKTTNKNKNKNKNKSHAAGVAMERGGGGSGSSFTHRGRKPLTILDDVVSANCSPVLRASGAQSPAVGGIAKLRMQMDPFTLDTSAASSRASSPGAKTKATATTATSTASATARVTSRVTSPLSPEKAKKKSKSKQKQQTKDAEIINLLLSSSLSKRPESSSEDASRVATALSSRSTSHDGASSNTSSDEAAGDPLASTDMTSYELRLNTDFISDSVREGGMGPLENTTNTTHTSHDRETSIFEADLDVDDMDGMDDVDDVASTYKAAAGFGAETKGSAADKDAASTTTAQDTQKTKKMTSADFEPLRCLGKGSYGTVLLVKQKATGRLYAQKQFKKASLVVHKKLVQQTKTERQILESVNRHPFVVKLFYAFQDHEKLYLILEYGQGGELFTHLSSERMFSEETSAFYMAEMVLALSHLHDTLGVVYRDLKPENCLLDAEGHLLLTDFGLSKVALPGPRSRAASDATTATMSSDVSGRTDVTDDACCHSILGTVEYMAPEVVEGKVYGRAVDWWSFGALGFDLMTGNPPFRGRNNAKIQENIVKQKLQLPYFLSPDAKDLLLRLLRKEPRKRLGANMPKDLGTIKGHRFFRKIDWRRLAAREVEPPILPVITDPELAENFASEFTELALSPVSSPVLPMREAFRSSGGGGGGGGSGGIGAAGGGGGGDAGAGVGMSAPRAPGPGMAGGSVNRDDPFGGFSFVASTSLLNESHFPLFKE